MWSSAELTVGDELQIPQSWVDSVAPPLHPPFPFMFAFRSPYEMLGKPQIFLSINESRLTASWNNPLAVNCFNPQKTGSEGVFQFCTGSVSPREEPGCKVLCNGERDGAHLTPPRPQTQNPESHSSKSKVMRQSTREPGQVVPREHLSPQQDRSWGQYLCLHCVNKPISDPDQHEAQGSLRQCSMASLKTCGSHNGLLRTWATVWWFIPVIPATQEVVTGSSTV
jgi:hypothetical protein